jgi:hypothetical protein
METTMTERVNATVLAAHLDLTKTRIRQLVKEGALSRRTDGTFDLDKSRVGYIKFLRTAARAVKSASASRVQNARARQIEVGNARREGELCEVQEALDFVDEVIGGLKSELQGFAARVTRDLELRKKIDDEIIQILERASARWASEGDKLRQPKA